MTHAIQAADLATVHLVPLTPFDAEGEFDPRIHKTHIARLRAAGMKVFLPAAASSGFYQLTTDEIIRVVGATVEAAGPESLVFAPLGLNAKNALRIARETQSSGASGVMFMPAVGPYLSDSGLRDYYARVLETSGARALIYKKTALPSVQTLLDLADHPQVVGIKYADPDVERFHDTIQRDDGKLTWLCGLAERYAASFMLQGAAGYTSGCGNLAPRTTLALHKALREGDNERAIQLQRTLLPIERFRGREGDSYNISMLQFAMTLLDEPLDFGRPRSPNRQLTNAEEREIAELLAPILETERQLSA